MLLWDITTTNTTDTTATTTKGYYKVQMRPVNYRAMEQQIQEWKDKVLPTLPQEEVELELDRR